MIFRHPIMFHPPPLTIINNSSPCGHRRRRKALIFEHPPPSLDYECRKSRKTNSPNRRGSPGSRGEAFTKTGVRPTAGTPADAESLATG